MITLKKYNWSKGWLYNRLFARLSLSQNILLGDRLRKQQARDADPKAIWQINFTGNLGEEAKEINLGSSRGTVGEVYFSLIWYQYKMTQYINLNIKFSNSQLNKSKSGIRNGTEVNLNLEMWLVIIMMRLTFYLNYY